MKRCPTSDPRNLHQKGFHLIGFLLIVKNGLILTSLYHHRLFGRFQFMIGVVVEKRNAK